MVGVDILRGLSDRYTLTDWKADMEKVVDPFTLQNPDCYRCYDSPFSQIFYQGLLQLTAVFSHGPKTG